MSDKFKLVTRRLILRPVTVSDADSILSYRSDSITNKYQGWIPNNIDDVHDFIQNRVSPDFNEKGTWFQLVIILINNDVLIGDIGLHFFDPDNKQVELGCTLGKEYQGCGYATESLISVIDFLFGKLDKHRIIASVDPGNTSSIKLVEGLGFRKEAHFKESIFSNGTWIDDMIYAILKYEWTSTRR